MPKLNATNKWWSKRPHWLLFAVEWLMAVHNGKQQIRPNQRGCSSCMRLWGKIGRGGRKPSFRSTSVLFAFSTPNWKERINAETTPPIIVGVSQISLITRQSPIFTLILTERDVIHRRKQEHLADYCRQRLILTQPLWEKYALQSKMLDAAGGKEATEGTRQSVVSQFLLRQRGSPLLS